ncbi:hypothetical protein A3D80_03440 [Candidatus Roizmanbacteria bacterium RIFCSPHIGHO2_02_FULL_40_13b]|uniref:Uncharacterized protein n=1 Tax=Candidatus Roizmanbacteria bacterium RIFCSPHIGHO2_01_FULL_39_24 TaxID=1802032 RepID=A0A1F7GJN5_9BACT|nr:MAG: hypothetical protein A2799_04375 [Candidatus Roizmanbacteria bacterium RIFCSPHIGHO2_01_FULL_39_24]OGK27020.1 MAG: hypothetical protein A3D80_03440 [Candidatus Roizmanbacteria bacterium RIFCSPHIGHO2_02_FULL_40_13b]OGK48825.1 MAG: hypothetical protein A3A56_01285 [Candidatus Roizmanbacteria bacterium RIFCSPLOWO2_01_FULL_40_32]OGK57288.1 MAG: hypothetical protein A3H83_00105 [Candidatus Roizmanbacteria bacterium RIFCSPLOWO2_02_FULL_39_8]
MNIMRVVVMVVVAVVILLVVLITWGCEDDWCYIFPWQGQGQIACTMEAKLCPDGSAVGRSGPNCQFAPCP